MGVGIIKALVFEDSNELKGENFQVLPLVVIILFWFLTFASYVLNSISSSNSTLSASCHSRSCHVNKKI